MTLKHMIACPYWLVSNIAGAKKVVGENPLSPEFHGGDVAHASQQGTFAEPP